ncbi:hypothetical protein [Gilvibacter sp.]|uniref:hypothetical protein n=1 Tax=Gilvibacter sp. TaxID=2729997 RepID=UPI003B5187F2
MIDDLTEATVAAEIENFVISDRLLSSYVSILESMAQSDYPNKLKLVCGDFGTGKTYFLKYLFYLLNPDTSERAFERMISQVSESSSETKMQLAYLKKRITKLQFDFIMFNADLHVYNDHGFTIVLFNEFNAHLGYNATDIALALLLEKPLDQKGKFEQFKEAIKSELGFNWDVDAATVSTFQLDEVLQIAKDVAPDLDVESAKQYLSNRDTPQINISLFLAEIKEYLKTKDENYRLVFMIDHILSFLSSNNAPTAQLIEFRALIMELINLDKRISIIASPLVNGEPQDNEDVHKVLSRLCDLKVVLS